MDKRIQLSKVEIIMGFVTSCVEDVADAMGLDYLEVYQRMDAVKMIDEYIVLRYEVLHTESRKNVTEGLIDILKRWEGSETAVHEISDKSETCRRFHDEETGLYLQGNLYVLNDFLAEISA